MAAASRLRSVLITGASSGIGAACAADLQRRGFDVFAGVRNPADFDRIRDTSLPRLTPVRLDLTREETIAAAARTIGAAVGARGLFGLINNAGIALSGPMELIPLGEFRRQLETNVVGHLAVIQAMLPLLRRGHGRIVNVGSTNGAMSPPYLGSYAASKHAMEAVSDALRIELRHWGIWVANVEAGAVRTPLWQKSAAAADALAAGVPAESLAPYRADLDAFRRAAARLEAAAVPVERVAEAVHCALISRWPRARFFVGVQPRLAFRILRVIPERVRDWIICKGLRLG